MSGRTGLTGLSVVELETLRAKVAAGAISTPLTSALLQAAGISNAKTIAEQLGGLDGRAITTVVDLVLAERTNAPCADLSLVWTGPEADGSTSRNTWVVLRELFEQAQHRVLIAGYTFDVGKDLFAPLHRRMKEDPSFEVQLFLNMERAQQGVDLSKYPKQVVQEFVVENWPWSAPYPTFYFDPRTIPPNSVVSLHAKCVVVDERRVLIGSANFTDRAQNRNIEIGVLIDDVAFAGEVAAHWMGLVNQDLVERCAP